MKKDDCKWSKWQMHGMASIGTKGQIVIPKSARSLLSLESGQNVAVISKDGVALIIVKSTELSELVEFLRNELQTDLLDKDQLNFSL